MAQLAGDVALYFQSLWEDLDAIGRGPSGGYNRFAWTDEDKVLREWFVSTATALGLSVTGDRVGNLWAWWGDPDADGAGLVVGSHLDSVPEGGAFDGPLGVVSSLVAIKQLKSEGYVPVKPVAVACFGDEEGARFGVACGGSRLLTGAMPAERGLGLTDVDGISMAEAMTKAGHDVDHVGRDDETLRRIGCFVELHIEQGKHLADTTWEAAAGSAIWPHGRFRVDFTGCADHAGTTRLVDRDDPMLDFAEFVQRARRMAELHDSVATVGKVAVNPNGVNAIPSRVTAWMDARGESASRVRAMVENITQDCQVREESWTDRTVFDPGVTATVADIIGGERGAAPIIETGAGHDAGIIANEGIPVTMLHVRNPTGTSHSPAEFAEESDCLTGSAHLASVIRELSGVRPVWDQPQPSETE